MINIKEFSKSLESFKRGNNGTIKTVIGEVSQFFHLSPVPNLTVLKPLSTQYSGDTTSKGIPKISIADTIHGCVQGLIPPEHGCLDTCSEYWKQYWTKVRVKDNQYRLNVYRIDASDIKSNKTDHFESNSDKSIAIFDQLLTGELPCFSELPCEHIGTVLIDITFINMQNKRPVVFFNINTTLRYDGKNPDRLGWYLHAGYYDLTLESDEIIDMKSDRENFFKRIEFAQRESVRIAEQNFTDFKKLMK